MRSVLADLRYAFRALLRGRLFSAVAVSCLALGIATNVTMFSVYDAMFLRPLPFADASRLVSVTGRHPETNRRTSLYVDDAATLRASVSGLSDIGTYSGRTVTLTDNGDPERVSTYMISVGLLPLLGVSPQRGGGFKPADYAADVPVVAMISDNLWRRRYQADEGILGRLIRLDNIPYTIVGVMPAHFKFPSRTEIWTPLSERATRSASMIGKLAPGLTVERANVELATKVLPAARGRTIRTGITRDFRAIGLGSEERTITAALLGATTVLLLIACVNVANLLLARGAGRRREIAIRASLGAGRGRIIRQLLTESVVLSLVGCALALPLAWYGIAWVRDAVPASDAFPYYMEWSLDVRTFIYAASIALLTGLLFGLAPAFDAAGRRLLDPLREGAGSGRGRRQRVVQSALIVTQTALAVILLAGASLFVRTYVGIDRVPLGYDMSHLMTMRVYFSGTPYDAAPAREQAIDAIAQRLATLPTAEASTVSDLVPLDDQGGSDGPVAIEGRTFEEGKEPVVQFAGVTGQWVETFGLRLVEGRTFHAEELLGKTPVALVDEKLAREFWPGVSAVGRKFRFSDEDANPWLTVIGVVPDIRTMKLDESGPPPPTAYLPHRFISPRNYGIIVRSRAEPESVTRGVRDAVRAVDPALALYDVFPMRQVRYVSFWMYIMWGLMFGAFSVIALLLAAAGIYGVIFYSVTQRRREIGVRVALGAGRAQVVRPMLTRSAMLAALGIAIGSVGAYWITPFVQDLLIGVQPNDLTGFIIVAATLAGVALIATWIPAWRASAVDPVIVLRDE